MPQIRNKPWPVFQLDTVVRRDIDSHDTVRVEAGGTPFTMTRDQMESQYEDRSMLSVLSSGSWAELRKPESAPRPDDTRSAMPELTESRIYSVSLPESDPQAFAFVRRWLRDGKLPEGMSVLEQSITKAEAKLLSMSQLKYEVKRVYPLREEVRTAPTVEKTLTLANMVAGDITDNRINKMLRSAEGLAKEELSAKVQQSSSPSKLKLQGVQAFVNAKAGDLNGLNARFLRAAAPYVTDFELSSKIEANLSGRTDELEQGVALTADELSQKIIALGGDNKSTFFTSEDQKKFIEMLLALEGPAAPTCDALVDLMRNAQAIDYKTRPAILARIVKLRGTIEDKIAFVSDKSAPVEEITQIGMQALSDPALRTALLNEIRAHTGYNIGRSQGALCVGVRPTYEELNGASTYTRYLSRAEEHWRAALPAMADAATITALNDYAAHVRARSAADQQAEAAHVAQQAAQAAAARGPFGIFRKSGR